MEQVKCTLADNMSKQKYLFFIQQSKFIRVSLEIDKSEIETEVELDITNQSRFLNLDNDSLVFTGGQDCSKLYVFDKGQEEINLLGKHINHKLISYGNQVFIISGGANSQQIPESSEFVDLSEKPYKVKQIAEILTQVRLFVGGRVNDQIYILNQESPMSNQINCQVYDIKLDKWEKMNLENNNLKIANSFSCQAANGFFLFSSSKEVFQFQGENFEMVSKTYQGLPYIDQTSIKNELVYCKGKIYFCIMDKIYQYNLAQNQWQQLAFQQKDQKKQDFNSTQNKFNNFSIQQEVSSRQQEDPFQQNMNRMNQFKSGMGMGGMRGMGFDMQTGMNMGMNMGMRGQNFRMIDLNSFEDQRRWNVPNMNFQQGNLGNLDMPKSIDEEDVLKDHRKDLLQLIEMGFGIKESIKELVNSRGLIQYSVERLANKIRKMENNYLIQKSIEILKKEDYQLSDGQKMLQMIEELKEKSEEEIKMIEIQEYHRLTLEKRESERKQELQRQEAEATKIQQLYELQLQKKKSEQIQQIEPIPQLQVASKSEPIQNYQEEVDLDEAEQEWYNQAENSEEESY